MSSPLGFRARRPQPGVLLLFTIAASLLVSGCGGSSKNANAPGPGDRFLLTNQAGLNESTASGTPRLFLKFDDGSFILDPAIAPDGKRIAFIRQAPARARPDGSIDFGSDLYVADRDGKNARLLVLHGAVAEFLRTPVWLSDGEILFGVRGRAADGRADFRTERLNLQTGQRSRLIEGGVDPAISADRKSIAFLKVDPVTQEEDLIVSATDLSSRRTVVDRNSGLALISGQVFSPDGTRIAFAAVDVGATTPTPRSGRPSDKTRLAALVHPFAQDVWIVNRDGTGLRRLTEIAENMPSLTWSGDGATLFAIGPVSFWQIEPASGKSEQIGQGVPLGQIVWIGR